MVKNVPKYKFGNVFYAIIHLGVDNMTQLKLPKYLRDFLIYLTTITGKSPRTREEYEYDLILFLRFIKAIETETPITDIHRIDIQTLGRKRRKPKMKRRKKS